MSKTIIIKLPEQDKIASSVLKGLNKRLQIMEEFTREAKKKKKKTQTEAEAQKMLSQITAMKHSLDR